MIHRNITELIGRTPLVEISGLEGQKARIAVKVESFNPGGSVKDRIALSMIEDAEARGVLAPGATIIEPTSGNTGVGLAWIGRVKGYKVILTMPETMSRERRSLLKAYGAELVLTPGTEGMKGAIRKAEELRAATPGAIILGQFVNPANPAAHEKYTGEEIWNDTEGDVAAFIAGVGTGGTVTGAGQYLKEQNPDIKVYAVEPEESRILEGGPNGPHKIQGIMPGFIPSILDQDLYDEIVHVSTEEAFEYQRKLSHEQGIFVGISAGAATAAGAKIAERPEFAGKNIVVVLPDTGERYLSML